MHYLHFMTVRAENHQEACDAVESSIVEWGNENNWRSICGSVCEDDTAYDTGEGRWTPSSYKIKDIEEMLKKALSEFDNEEEALATMTTVLAGEEPDDNWDWWKLSKYAKAKYEAGTQADNFDIWSVNYFDYQFDNFGITQKAHEYGEDEGKRYIVLIDMHS